MGETDDQTSLKNENVEDEESSARLASKIENITIAKEESTISDHYRKAQKYWSEVPATVNGMLGGFGYISAMDIQGSVTFLRELRVKGNQHALDCGAGIGRVTKNLLLPRYCKVDLVEQDKIFAEKSREYCSSGEKSTNQIENVYNMGLQEFNPECRKYDLIWSQWVLGHLTDEDLLEFFKRISGGLTKDGYFIIKENISKELIKDDLDSSVTRPLKTYEQLLRQAGFRIVKTTRQKSFPQELFPVYMIACRPIAQ